MLSTCFLLYMDYKLFKFSWDLHKRKCLYWLQNWFRFKYPSRGCSNLPQEDPDSPQEEAVTWHSILIILHLNWFPFHLPKCPFVLSRLFISSFLGIRFIEFCWNLYKIMSDDPDFPDYPIELIMFGFLTHHK